MVITKHSLSKKKVISNKGKSRQVVVSKKSRKNDAPDGSDASDNEYSAEDSLGFTRGFSLIGCLAGTRKLGQIYGASTAEYFMEQVVQLLDSLTWRVSFSELLIGLLLEPRNSPEFPVRAYVQGLLGLAEGQVFLRLEHPCWKALG